MCCHQEPGCLLAEFARDNVPCPGCRGSGRHGREWCSICADYCPGSVPRSEASSLATASTSVSSANFGKGHSKGHRRSGNTHSRPKDQERQNRLNANTKTLYHQTSREAAETILACGTMFRGSDGLAGGGIYFATDPVHTEHKAEHKGVILECRVRLGNVKEITTAGDSTITFRSLTKEGFDSVLVPRVRGHEYVVYNLDQVTPLRRI